MYRSINPLCQSIFIYMVQFTSGKTSISKTTRNSHACRDGTSDEGRFYGLFTISTKKIFVDFFRINAMRIKSNGLFESWLNYEKISNVNVVVILWKQSPKEIFKVHVLYQMLIQKIKCVVLIVYVKRIKFGD